MGSPTDYYLCRPMRVFTDLSSLPAFQNAVVTIGSFDGVHVGHRRILERVIYMARYVEGESVVISFDPHPRTILHANDTAFKLLQTTEEKISTLAGLGIDNLVLVPFSVEFAQQSAQEYVEQFLLKRFNPRVILIGYDHRFGAGREGNFAFLNQYRKVGSLEIMEIGAHEIDAVAVSSSKIRKALETSDIALANRFLGQPFTFTGTVVDGQKIGRTLGFPTANIEISDPYKIIPPPGIYAAQVGERLAALYIGDRPTLSPNGKSVIEVYILDFEGDLYGQKLRVEVLDFIRPDKKLENLESLKAQIEQDKKMIQQRIRHLNALNQQPQNAPKTNQILNLEIAVVILNYNTRQHLEQFLPSVVEHSAGARIIVADNGSPDDSISFLRVQYPQIQCIDLQENWGFAEGYNRALKQVHADVYVILNSDVEVAPNWLEPVLEAMRLNPKIAVAQPKILAWESGKAGTEKSNIFEYAGAAGGWIDQLGYPFCRGRIFSQREVDHGQYDAPQACFWASGAAFFIRAELYHQFGGFDGDYFAHNEEIDLCWRLKRAGYAIACIPESVVWHLGGGTLEYENPRKVFLNFRNSLYSLLKNEPWYKLLWLLPARFLLDGLAGARFAAKGQYRAIWAIVRAHFSFYEHIPSLLKKRKKVAQIIDKQRIGPENKSGVFPGSIILAHYLRRIKEFSKLGL